MQLVFEIYPGRIGIIMLSTLLSPTNSPALCSAVLCATPHLPHTHRRTTPSSANILAVSSTLMVSPQIYRPWRRARTPGTLLPSPIYRAAANSSVVAPTSCERGNSGSFPAPALTSPAAAPPPPPPHIHAAVYMGPITHRYSEVFWTSLPETEVPPEIVKRFEGKGMAITGYVCTRWPTTLPKGRKRGFFFGWSLGNGRFNRGFRGSKSCVPPFP